MNNFELMSGFLVAHGFAPNRSFTAANFHAFLDETRDMWFRSTMTELYVAFHRRFNGNSAALESNLKLVEQQDFHASCHVVGVAALCLLYVYVMRLCQKRLVPFESRLIMDHLASSFDNITSGTYTHDKVTKAPIWEDALCETIEPQFTILDCVEYWLTRERVANKDHPMTPYIDMQLISSG